MKKKGLLVLILAALVAAGVSAQSVLRFSVGAGGYITRDFGGGAEAATDSGYQVASLKTPYFGGGAFVFFDMAFLEASVGFTGAGGEWKGSGVLPGVSGTGTSGTALDYGLALKLPIALNTRLTIFPVLGINYRHVISAEIDRYEADNPGDFSAMWYKIGAGLDCSLTDNIFLRLGILYGLRNSNKFEKRLTENGMVDFLESAGVKVNIIPGHGLDVKLAVGYKF